MLSLSSFLFADWQELATPKDGYIKQVAISPANDSHFWAVDLTTLYKSEDNGTTWSIARSTNTNSWFAIAPGGQNTIYLKDYRSDDGGQSWVDISPIPASNAINVAIHPLNPLIIYAGGTSYVQRSIDGGENWEELGINGALKVAIDPLTPDTIYASIVDDIKWTTNGGEDWSVIQYNVGFNIERLIIYNHDIYTYTLNGGIRKSTDFGVSWEVIPVEIEWVTDINDCKVNGDGIFIVTDNGMYFSGNEGITWSKLSSDYDKILSIDIDENYYLIGTQYHGISRMDVGSSQWENVGLDQITFIPELVSSESTAIIKYSGSLYRLNSDGTTFSTITPPHIGSPSAGIAFSYANRFIAVSHDKVFLTEDGGDTWSFLSNGLGDLLGELCVSVDEQKIFYQNGTTSLARSLDHGATWSTINVQGVTGILDLHYSELNNLYVRDGFGYFMSSDEGESWISLDEGLPASFVLSGQGVFFDPNQSDRILCAVNALGETDSYRVYEKPAGTSSWIQVYASGLNPGAILPTKKIVFDPNTSDIYVAGNYLNDSWQTEYWLFRSTDNAETWSKVSQEFEFTTYPNYFFQKMDPYYMWYIRFSDKTIWKGDAQNMGLEPLLSVSTNSIDFGDTQVGLDTTIFVTVENVGTANLDVSSISVSGINADDFSSSASSLNISPGEASQLSITFAPQQIGVHTATIEIASDGGIENISLTGTGYAGSGVVAAFSGTPTSGDVPLTVQFTDVSTGGATTWSWDFGDNSAINTLQSPSHTYTEAGTYTVELSVDNGTSADTETKVNYITVSGSGGDLVTHFNNFDDGIIPPTNWTTTVTNMSNSWMAGNPAANNFSSVDGTNLYSAICPWVAADQDEWLIMPSTEMGAQANLVFYAGYSTSWLTSATLKLNISTDEGNSWSLLWEAENDAAGWIWRRQAIDLASYTGQIVKLGWQYIGNDGDLVGIDSVYLVTSTPIAVDEKLELPSTISLNQNFPNPFNPTTTISYNLPEESAVKLTVFDIRGQDVSTLQNGVKAAGFYEVQWRGMDQSGNPVSTGVYFCRMQAGSYSKVIKMLFLE